MSAAAMKPMTSSMVQSAGGLAGGGAAAAPLVVDDAGSGASGPRFGLGARAGVVTDTADCFSGSNGRFKPVVTLLLACKLAHFSHGLEAVSDDSISSIPVQHPRALHTLANHVCSDSTVKSFDGKRTV